MAFKAIGYGNIEMVDILLKNGASPFAKYHDDNAVSTAVKSKNLKILELVIENIKAREKKEPKDNKESLASIINNVKIKTPALLEAIKYGDIKMIEILLENGGDVFAKNKR